MKQFLVLSGKGGTGKTLVAVNLESVPTVVEFGEGGKRREWSKVLDHADSSVDQTPVSVNRPRADCRTGICRKPLIRRNPRSASRKPAAA